MIDDLKPYPEYKDSGVEWLDAIPNHWQSVQNQRIFKETTRPYLGDSETQLSLSQKQGLIPTHSMEENSLKTSSFDNWKVVIPGDIVLNRFKAHLGVFFAARERGIVTFHYGVFRSRFALAPKYFEYLYHTPLYCAIHGGRSNGMTVGLQNLSNQNFYNARSVVPPLPEQLAIVRFLDHADRLIKKYIRAKQKLIKLLEEQKQAIIHRAVTRGLDPHVKLKPSGVEWLGEVPEGWAMVRFKFVASRIVDCLHATPNYSESGTFPAIRTADISPGVVRLSSARRIEAAEYERWIERLEPKAGDILYSREGERFGIAACVPAGTRLCISQRMMVFRIRPDHNPEFVMWLLNNRQVYAQARQDVMGATAPHVNVSTIKNYAVALPCREEQDQLLQKISDLTDGFATAQANTARQISLLREYRTRLIADVVTGKLDIREAVASLPEVLEEAEQAAEVDEVADEELDGAESGEAEEAEG